MNIPVIIVSFINFGLLFVIIYLIKNIKKQDALGRTSE